MEIVKELLNIFLCWLPLIGGVAFFFWTQMKEEREYRKLYRDTCRSITNFCELAHDLMLLDCMEDE